MLVRFPSCSQPVQGGHTGCGGQGPSAEAKLVLLRDSGGALLSNAGGCQGDHPARQRAVEPVLHLPDLCPVALQMGEMKAHLFDILVPGGRGCFVC